MVGLVPAMTFQRGASARNTASITSGGRYGFSTTGA